MVSLLRTPWTVACFCLGGHSAASSPVQEMYWFFQCNKVKGIRSVVSASGDAASELHFRLALSSRIVKSSIKTDPRQAERSLSGNIRFGASCPSAKKVDVGVWRWNIGSVLKPSCKPILLSTQFHKYLLPLHHEESPIITLHLSRCTCRLL